MKVMCSKHGCQSRFQDCNCTVSRIATPYIWTMWPVIFFYILYCTVSRYRTAWISGGGLIDPSVTPFDTSPPPSIFIHSGPCPKEKGKLICLTFTGYIFLHFLKLDFNPFSGCFTCQNQFLSGKALIKRQALVVLCGHFLICISMHISPSQTYTEPSCLVIKGSRRSGCGQIMRL